MAIQYRKWDDVELDTWIEHGNFPAHVYLHDEVIWEGPAASWDVQPNGDLVIRRRWLADDKHGFAFEVIRLRDGRWSKCEYEGFGYDLEMILENERLAAEEAENEAARAQLTQGLPAGPNRQNRRTAPSPIRG